MFHYSAFWNNNSIEGGNQQSRNNNNLVFNSCPPGFQNQNDESKAIINSNISPFFNYPQSNKNVKKYNFSFKFYFFIVFLRKLMKFRINFKI